MIELARDLSKQFNAHIVDIKYFSAVANYDKKVKIATVSCRTTVNFLSAISE